MENSFQTSFIPKKPILANNATPVSNNTTSITMVVTFFIFIVVLLSAGGLFVYKNYFLLKNKEALSSNLSAIRDSFNKDIISELEMYDKRTSVAKGILSNHIVLSPLFEKINELTLSSIQYTDFEHKTVDNVFSVKMSGIARDYTSIAIQADVFNKNGNMFKEVIFSNLTKDKNNYVTFDVEFDVDPSLLSYANNITNRQSTVNSNTINTNPINLPTPVSDVTNINSTINTNTSDQALPVTNSTQ